MYHNSQIWDHLYKLPSSTSRKLQHLLVTGYAANALVDNEWCMHITLCSIQSQDWKVERMCKEVFECSWHNLRYYPRCCLEGLRELKTTIDQIWIQYVTNTQHDCYMLHHNVQHWWLDHILRSGADKLWPTDPSHPEWRYQEMSQHLWYLNIFQVHYGSFIDRHTNLLHT